MNPSDVNSNSIRSFAMASLVFGVLSLVTFFTVFLPLINGGLGIIFAVLSRREDRVFPSTSWWGIVLSAVGIVMGILILSYAVIAILIPMMTDPAFYQEINMMYKNSYGISLDELLGMH